jgi:hypothetical protein
MNADDFRDYTLSILFLRYRMAAALYRRPGVEINTKPVQRLWRQEGLTVPGRQRPRTRLGRSKSNTQRLQMEGTIGSWQKASQTPARVPAAPWRESSRYHSRDDRGGYVRSL